MKKSTVVKGALIGTTVTVAALCPLAGAVAGGYLVATGVAASTSTAATVALGAAGVVGGGVIGSAVGGIVSLPVKLWALGKAAKGVKKIASEGDVTINGRPFNDANLKPVFDKVIKDLDKKGPKIIGPDLKGPKL